MFKLTQRYLASSFLPPFALFMTFFVFFLLIFQLFRIVRVVINKGVEAGVVLNLVGDIAISIVPMAVPLACFFAVISVFSRASEQSELIAMRSLGSNKWYLATPPLVVSLFIGLVVLVLNLEVIPRANTHFRNTILRLTNKGVLTDIRPGQFFTDIPKIILFADKVKDGGRILSKVFISKTSDDKEQVIFANKGSLIKQRWDPTQIPSIRFHLTDGNITSTFKSKESGEAVVEKVLFEEYDFPIFGSGNITGLVTKHSMMTSSHLGNVIAGYKNDLVTANANNKKSILRSLAKAKLEYWRRINTPFQCIIFVLLGFCLGVRKGRGQAGGKDGFNLLILFSYYAVLFSLFGMAKNGYFPPLLVFLLPLTAATLFSFHLMRKIDWLS